MSRSNTGRRCTGAWGWPRLRAGPGLGRLRLRSWCPFIPIGKQQLLLRVTTIGTCAHGIMNALRTNNGALRRARKARAGGWVHAAAVVCQRTAGRARQHATREVAVVSCCTSAGEASTPGPGPGRGLSQSRDPRRSSKLLSPKALLLQLQQEDQAQTAPW